MIEVFKTDITNPQIADLICNQITYYFPGYRSNFDLSDCDRILRVQSNQAILTDELLAVLQHLGCNAEVLPDTIPEHLTDLQTSTHGCTCCDNEWATNL